MSTQHRLSQLSQQSQTKAQEDLEAPEAKRKTTATPSKAAASPDRQATRQRVPLSHSRYVSVDVHIQCYSCLWAQSQTPVYLRSC